MTTLLEQLQADGPADIDGLAAQRLVDYSELVRDFGADSQAASAFATENADGGSFTELAPVVVRTNRMFGRGVGSKARRFIPRDFEQAETLLTDADGEALCRFAELLQEVGPEHRQVAEFLDLHRDNGLLMELLDEVLTLELLHHLRGVFGSEREAFIERHNSRPGFKLRWQQTIGGG